MAAACLVTGCSGQDGDGPVGRMDDMPAGDGRLFVELPSAYTGVRFENRVRDTRALNIFSYRNYYNGGGVAVGDLNGDGLPDLMLTSNLEANRLFLNQGAFRFHDVTDDAGVAGHGFWTTGVTFVDVNGDGRLDIYVCYAGDKEDDRANELYINQGVNTNGVPTFTEEATAFGLADRGLATHAAFFDYDRDGDLDVYLVNNSSRPVSSLGLRNIRHVRHEGGGDKLYRNDGERFIDVSEEAGIFGSEIGFGLGVAIGDLNRDGWPDLYVSNDFFERDYLYVNKGDGTFGEVLDQQMPYISQSSMGLDIADINNDGRLDVYVTDMLPEDEYRFKMTAAFESWDQYQSKLKHYYHQLMRNMLHRNNGNGPFSEIGQLAGVDRTDWSWSALIADFDLDGHKDIHVTNGIPRDVTAQDYISYLADNETIMRAMEGKRVNFMELVEEMTSTALPNYAFRNNGDLTFSNVGASWGLNTEGFSNGAAYGDLDGDGALDLVVNNLNRPVSIYRNTTRAVGDNRFLQIDLRGEGPNRFGVGAKVTLTGDDRQFFQEVMPSRGFQSSVEYTLTFGIGAQDSIESVTVEWPDGRISVVQGVAADQRLTVEQATAVAAPQTDVEPPASRPLFTDVTDQVALGYRHRENEFADFEREPLLPRLLSTEGPFMAVSDVNGDGREDAFIGGAKDQPGRILLQQRGGTFVSSTPRVFESDRVSEDLGAVFFDATGNGHQDLYVVSGGSEYSDMAPALQDRLYLNDGRGGGGFQKAQLPPMNVSGSRVAAHDFDGDGDTDLFIGGRVVPWRYGVDPQSVLLQNDGRGRFTDVTAQAAPGLERIGMVTDAIWEDIDRDGWADLVVVGDWMPITVFRNAGGGTLRRLSVPGLADSHGWWNRIVAGDFTGDGRTDFIVGNVGLNTRFRASRAEPVRMYVKDFSKNGFVEQVVSYYNGGTSYPLALRNDLINVLPALAPRYPTFEDYALQGVTDIFSPAELADALVKQAYTFATALVTSNGDSSYTLEPLPHEAQLAPVYGILADDYDGDGDLDLLLAGNFDGVKPEIGRMSAGYGVFLRGDGRGEFTAVPASESGFSVPGQARDIQRIRSRQGPLYVVTRNNDRPLVFRVTGPAASF